VLMITARAACLPMASSRMSCSRWRASAARRLARAASCRCRRRCLRAASHCCLDLSRRDFSLCVCHQMVYRLCRCFCRHKHIFNVQPRAW